VAASHLARWSGTAWSGTFGSAPTGTNAEVQVVRSFDSGAGAELYVAGYFHEIGGVRVQHVARWSGSASENWRPLDDTVATGLDEVAYAMATYDEGEGPRLFVGGAFDWAASERVDGLARWDGVQWSAVQSPAGGGVDGAVFALAVHDDGSGAKLYAGGSFSLPGHYIGAWDGTEWAALASPGGEGTNGPVYALRGYDAAPAPGLYVGGLFLEAGGLPARGLARWDGASWHDVVAPAPPVAAIDGDVYALEVFDDGGGPALFAGGELTVSNRGATNLARWRGNEWSRLGTAGPDGPVMSLAAWDDGGGPALFAGGWFHHADAVEAPHIVRWNGSTWAPLAGPSGNGTDDVVYTLAPHVDGNGHALFAGGRFTHAGGLEAESVARWDGAGWLPLDDPSGYGLDGTVHALLSHNDGRGSSLWAAGSFAVAGGEVSRRIARWACDTIFWDDFETANPTRWDLLATATR
jgi:hypothetical protein